MSPLRICPREPEVLELIAIDQWPNRADADLAAHVNACECCRDLAVVATAVTDVRDATRDQIHVPDASLVWFRAQVRARQDAARRAARPMLFAQIAGFAVIVAALTVWSGGLTQWLGGSLASGWISLTSLFAQAPSFDQTVGSAQQFWSPTSAPLRWVLMAMGATSLVAVSLALGLSRLADGEGLGD